MGSHKCQLEKGQPHLPHLRIRQHRHGQGRSKRDGMGWDGMGWAGTRPDYEGWSEGGPLDKITGNGRTRGLSNSSSSSSNPVTNFPGPVSLYVTPTLPTEAGREGWKERAAGPLRLTDHIGSRVTRSAEVQLGQEAGSRKQSSEANPGRKAEGSTEFHCIGCYLEPGTSGGTALSSEMDSACITDGAATEGLDVQQEEERSRMMKKRGNSLHGSVLSFLLRTRDGPVQDKVSVRFQTQDDPQMWYYLL
ncbi:hypothetical protein TgHK011_001963 [Trichoderma gracile]|nr:hypothetical protein TgHK011_001963 [Trichoderma gracile]